MRAPSLAATSQAELARANVTSRFIHCHSISLVTKWPYQTQSIQGYRVEWQPYPQPSREDASPPE